MRRPIFNNFSESVVLGGFATALLSAAGSLALAVFWALTSFQPNIGWVLIGLFTMVLPAAIFGGLVGGAIFAVVNVLANLIGIGAGPVGYAALALLLSGTVALACVIKNGVAGVHLLPILFPIPVLSAALYVGGKVALSRAEARHQAAGRVAGGRHD